MAQRLTAYINDSKDELQKSYVISAAVVGRRDDWRAFNKAWAKVLRESPSISYFHALEWRGLKGEFLQFRENRKITDGARAAADAKWAALHDVIRRAPVTGVSVTLDVSAWDRLKRDHPKPLVIQENSYKTALQEVIYAIAKDARVGEHTISFVCDEDNRESV